MHAVIANFFPLCFMFWSAILNFVDFTDLFLWVGSLVLLEILQIFKMGNRSTLWMGRTLKL